VGTGAFARPASRSEASLHNSEDRAFPHDRIADPTALRIKMINRWDDSALQTVGSFDLSLANGEKWESKGRWDFSNKPHWGAGKLRGHVPDW